MSSYSLLHPNIQENLINSGFKNLTPIQEAAIPPILDKNNVLLIAGTSGGKTEAAFLPVLSLIGEENNISIKVIYIAPLKALLNNLELRIEKYADWVNKSVFKWHGDVSYSKKQKALLNMVDILIITPESIEVMLISNKINKSIFSDVRFFIIDEVHNFAESDRGIHLAALMNRIQLISKYPIQRIGMSATIFNPVEVLDWLAGTSCLPNKVIISSKNKKERMWFVNYQEDFQTAISSIENIICNTKSIVFVKSRSLAEKASHVFKNIKPYVHHASIDKDLREYVEEQMILEQHNSVISTSTLELGIDIGDLKIIVQYNAPPSISSLLQRIGRTGRPQGEIPTAYCFCEEPLEMLLTLAMINCAEKNIVSPIQLCDNNYHIFFHQVICLILQKLGIKHHEILKLRDMNKSFAGITDSDIEKLLEFLLKNDFLRNDGQVFLIGSELDKKINFKNYSWVYSTFTSNDDYDVYNYKTRIGSLDPNFVFDKIEPFNFTLAGKNWTAVDIDRVYMNIFVESTTDSQVPHWGSNAGNNVEKDVAEECYNLLTGKEPADNIKLDMAGNKELEHLRKTIPTISYIKGNKAFLITFAGSKINYTLCLILKVLSGFEVESNFYQIEIYKKGIIVNEIIKKINELLLVTVALMKFQEIEKLILPLIENFEGYSKFATFLPKDLNRKYLINKNYDINGVMDWLSSHNLSDTVYLSETQKYLGEK